MKIYQAVQKLIARTDRQTDIDSDLISLFPFLESRIKTQDVLVPGSGISPKGDGKFKGTRGGTTAKALVNHRLPSRPALPVSGYESYSGD
jgi:hypothetical protein